MMHDTMFDGIICGSPLRDKRRTHWGVEGHSCHPETFRCKRAEMNRWQNRDWMFDPVSGYVLDFSSKGAVCEATNFHSDLEGAKP